MLKREGSGKTSRDRTKKFVVIMSSAPLKHGYLMGCLYRITCAYVNNYKLSTISRKDYNMLENKNNTFIGIDVSKYKLDIYNSKAAIRKYIRALELSENLYIVIDLTGGYEALFVNEFYSKG